MIDKNLSFFIYNTKKEQFNCSFLVDCFIITLKYIVSLSINVVEPFILKINN